MNRLRLMVPLLLLCLLACAPGVALRPPVTPEVAATVEPATGGISGKVVDSNSGTSIPIASVSTDPPTSSVTTDTEGNFAIVDIPPGNYAITATKFGYTSVTVKVAVVAGKTTTADLHLITESNKPTTEPILTDGLVAYYPFNGNANDESGNGHNGKVYGASLAQDRFGNRESAYSFNGKSDYIHTNINASQFASNFTISAWVSFNNFNNSYPQILIGDNYYLVLHGMGPVYGNKKNFLTFYQQTGLDHAQSTRIGGLESASPLRTDQWYFIVITREGLQYSMFVDSILQVQDSSDHDIPLTGSSLYMGANIPGGGQRSGFLDGFIDDIRIYNRALSKLEIQSLFKENGWISD